MPASLQTKTLIKHLHQTQESYTRHVYAYARVRDGLRELCSAGISKNQCVLYARRNVLGFDGCRGWDSFEVHLGRGRAREEGVVIMGKGSANVVRHEVWVGPVITVASMCQHLNGARHRTVLLDLEPLVGELAEYAGSAPVALGGIQVGKFGIVLAGFAAIDVWAVQRNIIWEDEHCASCCGAALRFIEPLHHKVLMRCGPTIGAEGSVTDEYWTD